LTTLLLWVAVVVAIAQTTTAPLAHLVVLVAAVAVSNLQEHLAASALARREMLGQMALQEHLV
jgi:hypothetical protein